MSVNHEDAQKQAAKRDFGGLEAAYSQTFGARLETDAA